jgi:hypothetical protein
MLDDSIISSLTEEEKKVLLDLYMKIAANAEKNQPPVNKEEELLTKIEYQSLHQYDALEQGLSKLNSPVELVFTINCTVYEKNPAGELINNNDIFIKNYHVPLENQSQIKEFIELFFQKFVRVTEETCRKVIK